MNTGSFATRARRLLANWIMRINSMSLRDRIVLLFAILALIYFLWWLLLSLPLQTQTERLLKGMQATDKQINQLRQKAEDISRQVNSPVDPKMRAKLVQLNTQVAQQGRKILADHKHIISYQQLTETFREAAQAQSGITLLSMKGTGSKVILDVSGQKLVRQDLSLLFEVSSFKALINYLKKIESHDWQIGWDSLVYTVNKHPDGTLELRVHSVSYEQEPLEVR